MTARISSIALLLLIFVGAAGANDELVDRIKIEYDVFRLDNGLTTIVHSDHSTPTVFVGMWYGVGSKDEPEGRTGFAHLFEHLMFQGTENRDGEYFEPFTKAGATGMNGTTSEDRTNYFATVPSGALDMALWMESDRMSYLLGAVTQEALDEQRGVVQNEKRSRELRPYAKVGDRIRAGLYPAGHPYGHSIIGSMEDLDAAALEDVHEWFNTYYGASNVVLVLAGDVDLETAREKVTHYFAGVPAGVPLVKPQQWIPALEENHVEVMYDRVGQARIQRVWALPTLNHPDSTIMYLVNETLVNNKNAPLYSKLVDELQLASSVGGSAYSQVISGEYTLTINLREGVDPEQVLQVIDEVVAEYLEKGPDEELLRNAVLQANVSMLESMESKSTIGRMLAEGQLYSGDPLFVKKELTLLNSATAADLLETARRWLTRGYYQITVLPFPEYVTAEDPVDRTQIPVPSEVSNISFPDIQTATLRNGMKLVVANSGDLPLIDVMIRIDTGNMADATDAPGISDAMFALMERGTDKYNANELAAAKDRIAMNVRLGADDEFSSMSYRILTEYFDESLALAEEILRRPSFPQDELDKFQQQILAVLANFRTNPSRNDRQLFRRAIYGADHPFGGIWSPDLVRNLNRDRIVEFHDREVTPDAITVFLIGDINIDVAVSAFEKTFGDWRARSESQKRPVGEVSGQGRRVILVDQPGAPQSTIRAGHSLAPFDAAIDTELSVMNGAFGEDFEARINMNLREDKAWSYGMGSGIGRNTTGDQYFVVAGSVQTDKTVESMQEVLKEYREIVSTRPISAEELERVRLNRTRSLPGRFQSKRGFLNSMMTSDNFGLPLDYAETSADRINAVTLEAANARARATLRPDDLTWVVIGDLEKIEEGVRALGYGEVEVWDGFGNRLR
jgi:zinc protease